MSDTHDSLVNLNLKYANAPLTIKQFFDRHSDERCANQQSSISMDPHPDDGKDVSCDIEGFPETLPSFHPKDIPVFPSEEVLNEGMIYFFFLQIFIFVWVVTN